MNFKGFKKTAQDEHTATFTHEKMGHTITIAHKRLSPKLKTQLDAIPVQSFDEGGEVKPYGAMSLPGDDSSAGVAAVSGNSEGVQAPASSSPDAPQAAPPQAPLSGPADTMPKINPDPMGNQAATQAQIAALGEQKAGQQMMATAQGNQGVAQAAAETEHQKQANLEQDQFNKSNQALTDERVKIQNDIAQGHIDPNHYIHSMTTGGKISTTIGLILGGIGSGLTHGPNLAFQYLQNQIDRDINAQKEELGKKQNLLTHNMQAAGNLRAGMELTRLHSNDILSSRLRQEADKTQNLAAKGQLLNIAGMFDGQSAQLQHNLAIDKMQQTAFSGQGGAQNTGLVLETLPPEKRERAVQLPGGGLRLAVTKEGAKEVREQLQSIQPIFDSLDQLAALGPAALIPNSPANLKAHAIRAQLIPLVNENAGLKRLSGEDIGNIREMFTDPTKFSSIMGGQAKTSTFKSFLQNKLVSTMSNQLEGGGQSTQRSPSSGHNFGFTPKKFGGAKER